MKKIHRTVIVIGILFLLGVAFHSNIWFDESYSVAIAKHSFSEIATISGNDVHPPLYYWMLHIVGMLFGYSILSYRLFSVLGMAIVGILGYTHIRKDFGEKTGLIFSFLTYFLPVMNTYSQEIRMYSWACLLVLLVGIYGYRLYRNVKNKDTEKEKRKNLILFGVFSIACCYIHYYALATTGIINLILFIYFIKNRKEEKSLLRNFILLAIFQIICYIPWLMFFITQLQHVGGGFWIKLSLNTAIEVPSFQFKRQLDSNLDTNAIIAFVVAIGMYMYIAYQIYCAKKQKEEILPGILALSVYLIVILCMLVISFAMPILYARYVLVMTGLYMFGLAFFMAKEKKKWVTTILCVIILILGISSNLNNIMDHYDADNSKPIEYLQERMQKDDIIIYSKIGNGGVMAALFPDQKQYFYNKDFWDIEEAYKAFGPAMEVIYDYQEVLENYQGRIWLVDSEDMSLYEEFPKENMVTVEEPIRFQTKYQNCNYGIVLLEKLS